MAYILSLFNDKLNSRFTHDHGTFQITSQKCVNYYGFTELFWNTNSIDLFDVILKHHFKEKKHHCELSVSFHCDNSNDYYITNNANKKCKHTKLLLMQQRIHSLETPLHYLMKERYIVNGPEFYFYLQNTDLTVQDVSGNTPLHTYIYSRFGYFNLNVIYQYFLHDSNLFIKNNNGQTPKKLFYYGGLCYIFLEQLEKLQVLQEIWRMNFLNYDNLIQWLPLELLDDITNYFHIQEFLNYDALKKHGKFLEFFNF